MKIVTTMPLPEPLLAELGAEHAVVLARGEEDLLREVETADALIGSFGGGDGGRFQRLVAGAGRLRWIHTSSAGVDPLLCPELERSGATLTCAKGEVVGTLLAEHALALMLALTRGIAWSARQHTWQRGGDGGRSARELRGLTLGIAGYGGTGQALARFGSALQMDVVALRRAGRPAPPPPLRALLGFAELDELLAAADLVVNTLPLTAQTRGLFDQDRFRRMKPSACFVNVGRGETVRTDDLVRSLREGWIAGAGLDVTDPEPLPDDSPLWTMGNVVITPHIAGHSPQRAARNQALVAANLRRFLAGQPLLNAVDLHAGY